MQIIQFVSILPIGGEPHKVILEEPLDEVLQQMPGFLTLDENGYCYGTLADTIRVDGVACRVRQVEKEV